MEIKEITRDNLKVKIFETRSSMGTDAAKVISEKIGELLKEKDYINIVFAAAAIGSVSYPQNDFLDSLKEKDIGRQSCSLFSIKQQP